MTTLTNDTSGGGNVTIAWVKTPKRPNRAASLYWWWLETVCEASGHAGACVLLNSYRVGRFGTWWHRNVIVRLLQASSDHDWRRS